MTPSYLSRSWFQVLIVLLLVVLTFPHLSPSHIPGLDGSYVWGINHLFAQDYNQLLQLIYPIGPLGILKLSSTEGHNLEYFILFNLLVKSLLIYFSLKELLNTGANAKHLVISLLLLTLLCATSNIDVLLVSLCIILSFRSNRERRLTPFLIAALFASIALFIKTSFGIVAFLVLMCTIVQDYAISRSLRSPIIRLAALSTILLVTGALVYRLNLGLLLDYLLSIPRLSSGYSQALSLYPENNWWALGPFILLSLALPFLIKQKESRSMLFLMTLPAFAVWKHAMVREDPVHFKHLILFTIAFTVLLVLVSKKSYWKPILYGLLSFALLSSNYMQLSNEMPILMRLDGINNLSQIAAFDAFKAGQVEVTRQNFNVHQLPVDLRNSIGSSSIDVYPYEHSYAAANDLNWMPRKTLEIGASTSLWASSIAAAHYGEKEYPEKVLMHLSSDGQGGMLGSLDGRFLLNDEPELIDNLLSNYRLNEKTQELLLFERTESALLGEIQESPAFSMEMNEWIAVPHPDNAIVRLKVIVAQNFLGQAKGFLYKGDRMYVDYQLENRVTRSYRFIPSTAVRGLWCHPWITDPSTEWIEPKVERIRIRSEDSRFVQSKLLCTFEYTYLNSTDDPEPNAVYSLLGKSKLATDSVLSHFSIGDRANSGSIIIDTIPAGGYSKTWKIPLDSIWRHLDSRVETIDLNGYVVVSNDGGVGDLVIATEGTSNDIWLSKRSDSDKISATWTKAHLHLRLERLKDAQGTVSFYLWNSSETPMYLTHLDGVLRCLVPEG